MPCDHLDPDQVAALADRVRAEHGHLDVLVNDIWGGEGLHGPDDWNTPIWELDLADGLRMLRLGLETHLITSHHLLPLLLDRPAAGWWSRSPTAPPTTTPAATGSRSSTTWPRSR